MKRQKRSMTTASKPLHGCTCIDCMADVKRQWKFFTCVKSVRIDIPKKDTYVVHLTFK